MPNQALKQAVLASIISSFPLASICSRFTTFALWDYALQLEKDRAHWFDEPYWGMLVDEDHGVFTWKGGNTKHFPLLVVSSPLDLELRAKQYHSQRETYMSPSA